MRLLLWIYLLIVAVNPAVADAWKIMPESTLSFVVQAQDTELAGIFTAFDVILLTAEDNDRIKGFEVTVNLSATDMGDSDLNAMLSSAAWFDVNKHPTATFTTSKIKKLPTGQFETEGVLELKGVKESLTFPIQLEQVGNLVSITGSTSINRNAFHIGSGEWTSAETIGINVELAFSVRLNRAR